MHKLTILGAAMAVLLFASGTAMADQGCENAAIKTISEEETVYHGYSNNETKEQDPNAPGTSTKKTTKTRAAPQKCPEETTVEYISGPGKSSKNK